MSTSCVEQIHTAAVCRHPRTATAQSFARVFSNSSTCSDRHNQALGTIPGVIQAGVSLQPCQLSRLYNSTPTQHAQCSNERGVPWLEPAPISTIWHAVLTLLRSIQASPLRTPRHSARAGGGCGKRLSRTRRLPPTRPSAAELSAPASPPVAQAGAASCSCAGS